MTRPAGILIVDDNEINREICAMHLDHLDRPLFFAENGIAGLALARQLIPDLILLDIMMPRMDGLTMLRQLRTIDELAHIPVLMLTAKTDTPSVVEALKAGANDYLKKPFEEEEMVARVNTLLRNRYLERQLAEDLAAGAKMQQKFLANNKQAQELFIHHNIDIAIFNKPYSAISGDFYYAAATGPYSCSFFLGDSCGHGLPAALMSMRIIGLLQSLGRQNLRVNERLSLLNKDVTGLLPAGTFVAASLLDFDPSGIAFCNGGQPYPILVTDNHIAEVELDGPPLGFSPDAAYSRSFIPFSNGQKVIVYTDGLIETANQHEEVFGKKRLLRCLEQYGRTTQGYDLIACVLADIKQFTADTMADDDISLMVFERR